MTEFCKTGAFLALVKVVISQWYSSQEIGIAEKLVFKINTNIKIGSESMKKDSKSIMLLFYTSYFLLFPPLSTVELQGIPLDSFSLTPDSICYFVNCVSLRAPYLFFFRTRGVTKHLAHISCSSFAHKRGEECLSIGNFL